MIGLPIGSINKRPLSVSYTHLDVYKRQQIDSFDANEFLLETAQGWLMIQGKDLKLGKLDTERGDVIINGIIEALSYVSNKKGNAKETMMSKLFR